MAALFYHYANLHTLSSPLRFVVSPGTQELRG
jgi:hypothetical protein